MGLATHRVLLRLTSKAARSQGERPFLWVEMPPWKRWYKTARWQQLRIQIFVRDLFTCQCGCGQMEADTSLLVCDHKTPHRGDERLFWDETNLQTLLKSCHDRNKQKAEQASLHTRGVWH